MGLALSSMRRCVSINKQFQQSSWGQKLVATNGEGMGTIVSQSGKQPGKGCQGRSCEPAAAEQGGSGMGSRCPSSLSCRLGSLSSGMFCSCQAREQWRDVPTAGCH